MAVRIRRSVYDLPDGNDTLEWYGRAVAAMRQRPVSDPTSWSFQGAVHGNPGFDVPPGVAPFWDQCQHASWFFLPWHRGYLAAFEAVVSKAISELGGPADWALPYWNYSQNLADNPEARKLPPAFREQNLPDGSENPLFAPRTAAPDGDVNLGDAQVSLAALTESEFTSASSFHRGFGGPRTGFAHFGPSFGALESIPHNIVHMRIGGWMRDPNTAAFDPIFWLHHCNIDRLWEEWRAAESDHKNPTETAWLSDVPFNIHDGEGNPISFDAADMRNTTQVLHGYRYDSVEPPDDIVLVAGGGLEMADIEPELAGASEAPVSLDADETRVPVKMAPEAAGRSFTETALPTPVRVYLRLEQVTGTGVPGDYDVLIDLEDDDQPPYPVGTLTTFGIALASDPNNAHGGSGITEVFDITEAAERLKLTMQPAPKIRVRFRKVETRPVTEMIAPGPLQDVQPDNEAPNVTVGRIGVYFD